MDMNEFYEKLDEMFAANQVKEAENYLREKLKETSAWEEAAAVSPEAKLQFCQERLTVLNEWMGYCRSIGLEQEGILAATECRRLLQDNGLLQEVSLVNAWINMATTLCRFNRCEEGLACYVHGKSLLESLPETPDILYANAALNNNMATIYIAGKDWDNAMKLYQEAVRLLKLHPDSLGCLQELAITYANMSYIPSAREEALQRMIVLLRRRECQEHPDYAHTCEKCASMVDGIADTQPVTEEESQRLAVLAAAIRRGEADIV